jgi:hypothetical protein
LAAVDALSAAPRAQTNAPSLQKDVLVGLSLIVYQLGAHSDLRTGRVALPAHHVARAGPGFALFEPLIWHARALRSTPPPPPPVLTCARVRLAVRGRRSLGSSKEKLLAQVNEESSSRIYKMCADARLCCGGGLTARI